jgi:hypothetical protein
LLNSGVRLGTLARKTNENYSNPHGKKNICTTELQNCFPAVAARQFGNETQIDTGKSKAKKVAGT